jgi:hypothetical protein
MTTIELKTAIHKAVDNLPINALPELLDYISSIEQPPVKKDIKKIIDKIFEEDAELLRRLAE